MTPTLEFDQYTYAVQAHRMIAKAKGAGRGVSLVVPFRADTEDRQRIWDWLREYYAWHLPKAQIVEGHDHGIPFSKTTAWNDAMRHVTGDIIVLLDADAYLDTRVILHAAARIRAARRAGRRSWYIPYRRALRLTAEATCEFINDYSPFEPWTEPDPSWCDEGWGYDPYGCGNVNAHHYMAIVSVIPREAYDLLGGFDPRFAGWGAEDVSTSWALDTLWCKHRTLDAVVTTFGHQMFGRRYHRKWVGQARPDLNDWLGARYREAWGDVVKMRELVDEGLAHLEIDIDQWIDDGGTP